MFGWRRRGDWDEGALVWLCSICGAAVEAVAGAVAEGLALVLSGGICAVAAVAVAGAAVERLSVAGEVADGEGPRA